MALLRASILSSALVLRIWCQPVYMACPDAFAGASPQFENNGGDVDVIVVQAPLLSTNPVVGQKLGYLKMFHSALVLRQNQSGPDAKPKYWTLEFVAQHGFPPADLPVIDGSMILWNHTKSFFCLSHGIKHGQSHWTKTWDFAARLAVDQARKVFADLVDPVNTTAPTAQPRYNFLGAAPADGGRIMREITCADGVSWILHYIINDLGVPLSNGFRFNATSVNFKADRLIPVNIHNGTKLNEVVDYFKTMLKMMLSTRKDVSIIARILDLLQLFPVAFWYDTNEDQYYEISTTWPFITVAYNEKPLEAFPWPSLINQNRSKVLETLSPVIV